MSSRNKYFIYKSPNIAHCPACQSYKTAYRWILQKLKWLLICFHIGVPQLSRITVVKGASQHQVSFFPFFPYNSKHNLISNISQSIFMWFQCVLFKTWCCWTLLPSSVDGCVFTGLKFNLSIWQITSQFHSRWDSSWRPLTLELFQIKHNS